MNNLVEVRALYFIFKAPEETPCLSYNEETYIERGTWDEGTGHCPDSDPRGCSIGPGPLFIPSPKKKKLTWLFIINAVPACQTKVRGKMMLGELIGFRGFKRENKERKAGKKESPDGIQSSYMKRAARS